MEIALPALAAPVDELWNVLLDLTERLDVPWTLVGGQMVLLHALEHGQVAPQISQDGDIVADIRSSPRALTAVVETLEALGFEADISSDGIGHRYVRDALPRPVVVDLLAPEGVGEKADLTTTPPARTIQAPGGTQALNRTEVVRILHAGRSGTIPRPTLLAAIVGKAAATSLSSPQRHYRDLALLCALVPDPFAMTTELTSKDRSRLRLARALHDDAHPAWSLVPVSIRAQGQIAYSVLAPPR